MNEGRPGSRSGLSKARREEGGLDRDLADLLPDLRWQEWMGRIEHVQFASANPVGRRDHLARVVGEGASVDLLIVDLAIELEGRPYEVAQVGAGCMLRTRAGHASVIRAAADVSAQALNLSEFDLTVLAAIAFHPPISRDLIGRLVKRDLIGTGPRESRRGAPYTFVTKETFLATFWMESLRDLPNPEQYRRCQSGQSVMPAGAGSRAYAVSSARRRSSPCCRRRRASAGSSASA